MMQSTGLACVRPGFNPNMNKRHKLGLHPTLNASNAAIQMGGFPSLLDESLKFTDRGSMTARFNPEGMKLSRLQGERFFLWSMDLGNRV